MDQVCILLKAYYEALYEQLAAAKDLLAVRIDKLLRQQIAELETEDFNEKKYKAYYDACLAFVEERLETYNPIGIQYTFDRIRTAQARQLELQLDWYDSRTEFEALMELVRTNAEPDMTEQRLQQLAHQLIKQAGAFPDNSIISAYQAQPALSKLPDYIVARAIEELIR